MNDVKLVSITPNAEQTMGYIARVSNPANQNNPDVSGLLAYCIRHNHWSVFEQATMTLELQTSRAISAQIIRHRSFTFQEFSQRYASVDITASDVVPDLRLQDNKNRQNSIDALPKDIKADYQLLIAQHFAQTQALYDQMLKDGIAKECARMILPMASPTTIYMTGNIRNWITYINLRTANGTQKEHADLAWKAREIFVKQLPIVAQALGWK